MSDHPTFYDNDQSEDIPEPPSSKPGAKRRASRAGTRSVASLTPEQLARKRANDREAQRSIRQRTKNHIEELERRIRELSGEDEPQTIEEIKRRNLELEEELRHLRETLARSEGSVISSPELAPLSTRYGSDMIDPPYSYSPQWSSPGPSSLSSSPYTSSSADDLISSLAPDYSTLKYDFSDPGSARSDTFSPSLTAIDMTGSPPHVTPAVNRRGMPFNPRPHFGRSRSYPNGRLGLPSGQAWQPVSSSMSSRMSTAMIGIAQPSMLSQSFAPTSNPSPLNANMVVMGPIPTTRLPIGLTSNPIGMDGNIADMRQTAVVGDTIPEIVSPGKAESALETNGNGSEMIPLTPRRVQGFTYDVPPSFGNQSALNTWELPLRFVPPTGPLDSILIGLLQRQRTMALSGARGAAVIGPYHPNLRGLLNLEISMSTHPVSSVLVDLIRRTQLRGLAEKAAAIYVIYRHTQWQISPSAETYNLLPDWYGPRASQILTGHPIWSTLMIWGKLRDIVINNQEMYATDEFQHLYTSCLNINWQYGDQNILVFEGDEVRVTDVFTRHVNIQANWSLDEPFQRRYPELRHACKFSELPGQHVQQPMQIINHGQ